MPWTETQQVAMAIGPKITAILSIFGSGYIIREAFFMDRKKRQKAFYRIMIGMSCSDILASAFLFLTTWPIPKEYVGIVYANMGNTQVCTMQGFFLQLGIMTPLYNGVLASYYFMSIRLGWREEKIAKVEKFLHCAVLLFGLSTAVTGLRLTLFNNANAWCWIAPYPANCQQSYQLSLEDDGETTTTTCERGDNANIYRWAFWYAPVWLMILWVTTSMTLTYLSVLMVDKKMQSYTSRFTSSILSSNDSSRRSNTFKSSGGSGEMSLGSGGSGEISLGATSTSHKRPSQAEQTAIGLERQTWKRSRKVANQGMFYVLAFIATWIFPTITRSMQLANKIPPFGCIFMLALMTPFQGFLNFLVYIRPRVIEYYDTRKKQQQRQQQRRNTKKFLPTAGNNNSKTANDDVEQASKEIKNNNSHDETMKIIAEEEISSESSNSESSINASNEGIAADYPKVSPSEQATYMCFGTSE